MKKGELMTPAKLKMFLAQVHEGTLSQEQMLAESAAFLKAVEEKEEDDEEQVHIGPLSSGRGSERIISPSHRKSVLSWWSRGSGGRTQRSPRTWIFLPISSVMRRRSS